MEPKASSCIPLEPAYLHAERLGSKAMSGECSFQCPARIPSIQSGHNAAEWIVFLHIKSIYVPRFQ